MNTTQDDGGPAFPCNDINDDLTYPRGMSLRDYFAGMAISPIYKLGCGEITEAEMAADAYSFADAMLVARKEAR